MRPVTVLLVWVATWTFSRETRAHVTFPFRPFIDIGLPAHL
ncbi:MAG: hypothetical protein BJ554DRAFT_6775 [Olpidium bornovanus]|uniref:Uncharacterized protein n=1 Tax=Olpidium bornovanus TaxID=278681 RepID=A0A8H7ZXN4_9FUNG|nr:MAG: hypothetical protein BJ554DRAFT_6775 [Olpidium bornovanus]